MIRSGKRRVTEDLLYRALKFLNDPLPALEGRGFTLEVSIVTPPIAGLLNDPVGLVFINLTPETHIVE
jgi:hypothetical protein